MVAASSKVSAKKLRANRRNAKKSTGPKTADGKRISSQNATSHGIYCRDVVLDGENEATFVVLRDSYIRRLRPQDELELSFVDRVAADQWKLRRLQEAEKNLYAFRRQAHIDLFDKRRKGELDVADFDEERWERVDKVIDPMTEPQFTAMCSGLGDAAVTMLSLMGDEKCLLERYDKHRQRLELSISRAMRELRLLQAPLKKGQAPLPPSPFSNERWPITSSLAKSIEELEQTEDPYDIAALKEKFKDFLEDDDETDEEQDDQETAQEQPVSPDTSNTQNEPTADPSPATPAPAEPCEQPLDQNQPPLVDPPTKNALLNTMIDHLHLTELDEREGS